MPSPSRDVPSSRPFLPAVDLQPPPSPSTQRTLRRLQSAHALGAKAALQPSLISQQRQREQLLQLQQQHADTHASPLYTPTLQYVPPQPAFRNLSPVRRDASAAVGGANRSPQRYRANSDAVPPPPALQQNVNVNTPAISTSSRGSLRKSARFSHANLSLQHLMRDGPPDGDYLGALETARFKVLEGSIKSDSDGMSSMRIYVWLILLDAPILPTDDYLALVHRGASPAYSKIRNDTFRTLTTDPLFRRRVSEASLIRLLNAIAWRLHDAREVQRSRRSLASGSPSTHTTDSASVTSPSQPQSQHSASSPAAKNRARALTLTTEGSESNVTAEPGTYVQGMNVLAAPFLYAARSEAEAFVAFHALLTRECPGYIRGAMNGVHKGLALVDKVLAIIDRPLSDYLKSRGLSAEIYAFPSVLTLCACTPPLPEVLRLWDFLFAYGPHLNILCIVAQLHMMRDSILRSTSPSNLLRSFPALQSEMIKQLTMTIIKLIPRDVYREIVEHAR